MPLIAHNSLPTFERLKQDGESVLTPDRAAKQDIRELHIGLLNMMPDAALAATERQFFRLIGGSNQIAQFYVHPFSLEQIPRSDSARQHIQDYYENFDNIKRQGLDALIITGANVSQPELAKEVFWEPLIEVIDWAYHNVTSTLCSCLATHAVMQFRYQQHRHSLGKKCWGVFQHEVIERWHPLVKGVNTRFNVPHSRFNQVTPEQFAQAGVKVLVASREAGVHLAVSPDLFRLVFFQGHPEYDTNSLLKEYKREVNRFSNGDLETYPPFPDHYFGATQKAIMNEYRWRLQFAMQNQTALPEFPEALILNNLHNTWRDSGEAILNNWLGKVYQLTNNDRTLPFMDNVNPDDPLGLLESVQSL